MSAILQDIAGKAKAIEDKGIIEDEALKGILSDIEKLRNQIHDIENKWIHSNDKNKLYFYLVIRNLSLSLKRISERFSNAKTSDDNPQIALDTLSLIPIATEILETTNNEVPYTETEGKILDLLHRFMDVAADANLLELNNNILNKYDEALVVETLDNMMEQIGIPAKLPNDIDIDKSDKSFS